MPKTAVKAAKTIAVLPFVNMSSSDENEYFSDGMTEEIINALAKIKGLKVTSRTSSFHFKNQNIPLQQIAQALQVSTILEGSIRLVDSKMRLTAQLINAEDDFHFWSETFDRSLEDIFAVQDEISLLIADKLREHLGHLEIADQLVDHPNISVDAYKRHLESRYHLLKMAKEEIDKGMALAESVIADAPDFAPPYLNVHLGYTLLSTIGLIPAVEGFTKGAPYLEKAIALAPDLPECQLHLSYLALLQEWDLATTYQHLQKAVEIRPTVEYYQSMASTLVAESRFKAANNYLATALQLDPFSAINYHLQGFIYYCQEQYDKAITCFVKSASLKSNFVTSTLYRGQSLLLLGRTTEAMAFFEGLPPDEAKDLMKVGGITLTHAATGNSAQAHAGIQTLEAALETELMGRAVNLLILCRALLQEYDACLDLIEKGIQLRLPMMVYLPIEPILKPLRTNHRFQQLMPQILGKATAVKVPKRKYKKSLLDKKTLQAYRNKLTALMVEEQPFLDPALSLRSLAAMLDLPPNHLSQLLNEGFQQNFSEFVNTYRLEDFKAKIADPKHQHLTLLGLAFDSGFNSKTVFNTFFKKMEGKTPRAYWKEVMG